MGVALKTTVYGSDMIPGLHLKTCTVTPLYLVLLPKCTVTWVVVIELGLVPSKFSKLSALMPRIAGGHKTPKCTILKSPSQCQEESGLMLSKTPEDSLLQGQIPVSNLLSVEITFFSLKIHFTT